MPPWSSTAGEIAGRARAARRRSAPRSCGRGTGRRGAVRRLTGWTWTAWTRTGLGLLAVDRQVDERVRAGVAAEQLELVGVDRDAGRSRRRGRRRRPAGVPARRRRATFLPVDLAVFGGQRRAGGGHGAEPLDRMLSWVAGCGSPAGPEVARRPERPLGYHEPRPRRPIESRRRCSIAAWQPPS